MSLLDRAVAEGIADGVEHALTRRRRVGDTIIVKDRQGARLTATVSRIADNGSLYVTFGTRLDDGRLVEHAYLEAYGPG